MDDTVVDIIQISNDYIYLLVIAIITSVIVIIWYLTLKRMVNILSIELVLYNRGDFVTFTLNELHNFPLNSIKYPSEKILKYAKIVNKAFSNKLQIKYHSSYININTIKLALPDVLKVPLKSNFALKRIIANNEYNHKLIIKYNSSIIGVYGENCFNIPLPNQSGFSGHSYCKWYKQISETQEFNLNKTKKTNTANEILYNMKKPKQIVKRGKNNQHNKNKSSKNQEIPMHLAKEKKNMDTIQIEEPIYETIDSTNEDKNENNSDTDSSFEPVKELKQNNKSQASLHIDFSESD